MRARCQGLPISNSCSRREALRYGALLVAGAYGLASHGVEAARGWCRSDPLVLIDGIIADIFCTAPLAALLEVTGPTDIVITVPDGVSAKLVLAGIGFGRGENVRFANSRDLTRSHEHIDVKVEVLVPAREDLPIGVEFAPRIIGILNPARAEGFANSLIALSTVLADGELNILGFKEESSRHKLSDRRKRHPGRKHRRRR